MNAGDCFINVKTDRHRSHCWVIISDPDQDRDEVVIVNFTSWTDRRVDASCMIQPGEHPFVTKQTCINYREARLTSIDTIAQGIKGRVLLPIQAASPELLHRIRQGAYQSDFCEGWVIEILDRQNLLSNP